MKHLILEHLGQNWLAIGAAIALLAMGSYYGPGHWYVLHSVTIADAPSFDAMRIEADREIIRPFYGSFDVAIWPEDRSAPVCHGGGGFPYNPTAQRVVVRDMRWWSGDQRPPCDGEMKPGGYIAQTCVTIHPDEWWLFWLPPPRTCVWSNVFRKTEAPE